ncbi:four-carbon acid sugar kinase family protein [Brucella cytisi]|uniref:four-carbon acid sugar kinase family protein n=1 Tax=Brucella cytisi TaxID=407152 RepID=UPI00313EC076
MDRSGRIGIIADDMTGALMVAAYYETAGIRAMVVTEIDAIKDCGGETIIIWAGRTRLIDPVEACRQADHAAAAFDAIGCDQVVYKVCASFDSTEQGNIGPVADILYKRYKPDSLLFCPGFPKFNATVHQGYLFYRSRLVSESVKRYDPATPMSDPDMVRFIGKQTHQPIGLLPHSVLLQGIEAAQTHLDALAKQGTRYCVVDASDNGDVEIAARLAARQPTFVSSDATLIQLGLDRFAPNPPIVVDPPAPTGGTAAVLVGTVGPIADAQIADFARHSPVLTLDLLTDGSVEDMVDRAMTWANPYHGHQPYLISTAVSDARVKEIQSELGKRGSSEKAELLMSELAVAIVARGVDRLIVVGGETSGGVIARLGLRRLRAHPDNGIGTGFCYSEGSEGIAFFFKSGKVGTETVIRDALRLM